MIQARLVLRNDSSANLMNKNPVLLQGEPAYDNEQGILKIGDGITPWNSLPALNTGGSGGGGPIGIATDKIIGGVLSSTEPNKIKVEENGQMSLNQVSTSLLYVPIDDELIINGGAS